MRRAGRYALISLAALAAVFFAAVFFLMTSRTVFRQVFSRFAPSGLSVKSISGRLAGPVRLEGISYDLKGTKVRIGSLTMDWRPSELIYMDIHITRLDIVNMRVEATRERKPPAPAGPLPQLSLPSFLTVQLSSATAENIEYVPAKKAPKKKKPVVIGRLALNAAMRGKTLQIQALKASGPGFSFDIRGKINPQDGYPLVLKTGWTFVHGAYPAARGAGELSGTLDRLHVTQAIGPPYNMDADFIVSGLSGQKVPGGEKQKPAWDGRISWHALQVPPSLGHAPGKPPVMSTSGQLFTKGNTGAYSMYLDMFFLMAKERKTAPQNRLIVAGTGNATGFLINKLSGNILGGTLRGGGRVTWGKPSVGWSLSLGVKGLDPGLASPKWPGTVDLEASTKGAIAGQRRSITLDIASALGTLRGYPVSASGRLIMKERSLFIPRFDARSGQTFITASGSATPAVSSGRPVRRWDFSWGISAKNLAELLPGAGGSLFAKGTVKGLGKKPVVAARMAGEDTAYKKYRVKTFHAAVRIDLSGHTASDLALNAVGLRVDKRQVRMVRLTAAGGLRRHRIALSAEGRKAALSLVLKGGYSAGLWSGDISSLAISGNGYGTWRLLHPAPLRLSKVAALLNGCVANGAARLCLLADWQKPKGARVKLSASRVPLGLFAPVMPAGLSVTGVLNGGADIFYSQQKALTGKADIRLAGGTLSYSLKGKTVRRSFRESTLQMVSTARAALVNFDMPFTEGGGMKGRVSISPPLLSAGPKGPLPVQARVQLSASRVPLGLFAPVMPAGLSVTGVLNGGADITYVERKALTGRADIMLAGGALAYSLKGKTVRRSFRESTLQMVSTARAALVNFDMPFTEGGGMKGRVSISPPLLSAGPKGPLPVQARVQLSVARVPLGLFAPLMPPGLAVKGVLNGDADITYVERKALTGKADVRLTGGALAYSLQGRSLRLNLKESTLRVVSTAKQVLVGLDIPFVQGGGINGRIIASPPPVQSSVAKGQPPGPAKKAKTGEKPAGRPIAVKGSVHMEVPNLEILASVLPAVKNARGVLLADIGVSGDLPHPGISGRLTLEKTSATLPSLGITVGGSMTAASAGPNRFHVQGSFTSGGGHMDLKGDIVRTPANVWSLALGIKGQNFQVVNIPEAKATASPDLAVALHGKEAFVRGEVTIPSADIKPLQVSGAIRPSRDVVVVSERGKPVKVSEWKVHADVRVILGKKISFNGFGLKSIITGQVAVHEVPGKVATGQGTLVIVKGTYKAYGQNLTIENGRLLYSGQPINDPGLAIKAVRKIKAQDVTAGIDVSGTLKRPKVTLFSEPPMDQTEALSYLVLGKPVGSATGSQGNLLYGAATSLGLAGGALLANRIGALFGIKASVEKTPPQTPAGKEQATLFLGRYLSPRLYVAYGVGIFETSNVFRVRYRVTKNWLVQTEGGTETGGDVLYKLQWQ